MSAPKAQPSDHDYVDTTAGGEFEPSTHSMGDTPGLGANNVTRAGLPNADPDGFDEDRSDLHSADLNDIPPVQGSEARSEQQTGLVAGSVPSFPEETRQHNDVAAPTAATASHDGERSAGSGPGQGESGGDGYSAQGDFAGKGEAGLDGDEQEEHRRAVEQARQNITSLGIQNRRD